MVSILVCQRNVVTFNIQIQIWAVLTAYSNKGHHTIIVMFYFALYFIALSPSLTRHHHHPNFRSLFMQRVLISRSIFTFPLCFIIVVITFSSLLSLSDQRTLGRMIMESTRRILGHLLVCLVIRSHCSLINIVCFAHSLSHSLIYSRAYGKEVFVQCL